MFSLFQDSSDTRPPLPDPAFNRRCSLLASDVSLFKYDTDKRSTLSERQSSHQCVMLVRYAAFFSCFLFIFIPHTNGLKWEACQFDAQWRWMLLFAARRGRLRFGASSWESKSGSSAVHATASWLISRIGSERSCSNKDKRKELRIYLLRQSTSCCYSDAYCYRIKINSSAFKKLSFSKIIDTCCFFTNRWSTRRTLRSWKVGVTLSLELNSSTLRTSALSSLRYNHRDMNLMLKPLHRKKPHDYCLCHGLMVKHSPIQR